MDVLGGIGLGLGALQGIINTAQSAHVNQQNIAFQKEENAKNRAMVQQQNALNIAQAERAYRRSTAGHQVGLMMQAGMSRAGAINAINGGGHYTPAPINAAQGEAPQAEYNPVDMSNAIQAATAISAQKSAEKMQDKQIKAQQEENAANRENAVAVANINAEAAKYGVDSNAAIARARLEYERLALDRELQFKNDDLQFRKDQYEYGKRLIDAQTNLAKAQKDDIRAKLDEFKSAPATNARQAEYQVREMAALYNYRVNENDFYEYLRDNYVKGEDGNYYPVAKTQLGTYDQGVIGSFRGTGELANEFWSMIFSIIPVKPLLECIKLFGN